MGSGLERGHGDTLMLRSVVGMGEGQGQKHRFTEKEMEKVLKGRGQPGQMSRMMSHFTTSYEL